MSDGGAIQGLNAVFAGQKIRPYSSLRTEYVRVMSILMSKCSEVLPGLLCMCVCVCEVIAWVKVGGWLQNKTRNESLRG